MNIDKWVEYTPMCDACQIRGRDLHEGRIHNVRKESIAYARTMGWVVRNGKTLCPRCKVKPLAAAQS